MPPLLPAPSLPLTLSVRKYRPGYRFESNLWEKKTPHTFSKAAAPQSSLPGISTPTSCCPFSSGFWGSERREESGREVRGGWGGGGRGRRIRIKRGGEYREGVESVESSTWWVSSLVVDDHAVLPSPPAIRLRHHLLFFHLNPAWPLTLASILIHPHANRQPASPWGRNMTLSMTYNGHLSGCSAAAPPGGHKRHSHQFFFLLQHSGTTFITDAQVQ